MKFSVLKTSACAIAALTLMASTASAVTIFQDTFNRANSNSVGNGWTELEDDNNDVAIRTNRLRLRDTLGGEPDAAAASPLIDATGFENISVDFRWRSLGPNEGSDDLYLSFALTPAPALTNQNAWTEVFNGSSGGTSFSTENVALAGAEDSMFNLMFWTDVSRFNEGFEITGVRVTGDAISAVPLPAALPMMLAGLGALGVARRRKTKA